MEYSWEEIWNSFLQSLWVSLPLIVVFMLWFITLYFVQKLFKLSDSTISMLLNIGGIILCALGFILGIKLGMNTR